MICTFGDTTDVVWWRELQLPDALGRSGWDGRLLAAAARAGARLAPDADATRYAELAGKTVKQAQARIVELLARGRRPRRRSEADHARGEVLREAATARSRS